MRCLRTPPHCLKKNGTFARSHWSRKRNTHSFWRGRAPGPLLPTNDHPVDPTQVHLAEVLEQWLNREELTAAGTWLVPRQVHDPVKLDDVTGTRDGMLVNFTAPGRDSDRPAPPPAHTRLRKAGGNQPREANCPVMRFLMTYMGAAPMLHGWKVPCCPSLEERSTNRCAHVGSTNKKAGTALHSGKCVTVPAYFSTGRLGVRLSFVQSSDDSLDLHPIPRRTGLQLMAHRRMQESSLSRDTTRRSGRPRVNDSAAA